MKQHPPLLKGLKENVPILFKKLDLPFSQDNADKLNNLIRNNERFFNIIVRKEKNDLILKIRLQDDKEIARDLKREIKLSLFFKNNPSGNKISIPHIISFGKYRSLQWYLREYQPGTLTGQMQKDHGFRKEFMKKVDPIELADIIISYQAFGLEKIKELNLHRHGGWWYRQDFDFYKKNFLQYYVPSVLNKNLLTEDDVEKICELLSKNKKLLDNEAKYLCHGDLYPNNILITPENKISFLDWGICNLNNQSFDIAFIYFCAWKNEKWKKHFLDYCLKKQEDKKKFAKLFRISLISLSTRFACHFWNQINNEGAQAANKEYLLILENNIKTLKTALINSNTI